ncbi:MAG: hypothetical protein LBS57_02645, partial [Treponema sp.]|nr:hypothetical protein [Treponema sp.]
MKEYTLGIDLGSGSIKLTLLGRDGKIAAVQGCEYPTEFPCPGWSEQDPAKWCDALCHALKRLCTQSVHPAEIRGIAVDAATHTAVLLDEAVRPLGNAILWTDQRSGEEVARLKERYADLIKRETLNTPTTVWTMPQFLWLKKHRPAVWEKVRHIHFAKDYLRY